MSTPFQKLEEIFHDAAGLAGSERSAFIERACGGDRELRARLEVLLLEDDSGTRGVLSSPPADSLDLTMPTRIGEFEVLALLGEGGMGQVYQARQESPNRLVALKVIRDRLGSREGDRRFAREAELLAQLKHPGIAQIYSSGVAKDQDGQQRRFIAMELVTGKPLLAHAREAGLTRSQQIELLARACDAVQHAHQRGVIHRDLKSANILVESGGDDPIGQPKVLDFGVARLRDESGVERSMATEPGRIIGTLAYMSPEQLEGDPRLIDTRTDVYALGVLGYELLAGTAPLQLAEKGLTEAARIIRDVDPPALGQVARGCRGEVETIIARAMEKTRERRYSGAGELAGDLRRYLRHEPIQARPASTMYLLRKFGRRHKALVGGASVAVIAVVVGLAVSAVQYSRAVRAAARSEQVATLLKQMISGINPTIAQARDTSLLKEIVDSTAQSIGQTLAGQPGVEAELRKVIGDVYYSIGEYGPAEDQYKAALEKFVKAEGRKTENVAQVLIKYEAVLNATNRDAPAIAAAQEALEIRGALFKPESDEVADATACVGAALHRTDLAAASAMLEKAVGIYERIDGPESVSVARTLEHLGQVFTDGAQIDRAEVALKRSFDIRSKVLGLDNFDTVNVGGLLGDAYVAQQRYAEAEPYCRIYAEKTAKLMPPTQPSVPLAWAALAQVVHKQGKVGEAIAIYRAQIAPLTRIQGADDFNVGTLHNNLAAALVDAGAFDEAEREYNEALRIFRAPGPENLRETFVYLGMANIAWGRGDFVSAERSARRAYEVGGRTLPPKHPGILQSALRLSACQVELAFANNPPAASTADQEAGAARAREAITLAQTGMTGFAGTLGPDAFNTWIARGRLACANAALVLVETGRAAPDRERAEAAGRELAEVAVALRSRPNLGTFPMRDMIRTDVARALVRLYGADQGDSAKQELKRGASCDLADLVSELEDKRRDARGVAGAPADAIP